MTRSDLHAMLYSRFITVEQVLVRQAEMAVQAGELPELPPFDTDLKIAREAFERATFFADQYLDLERQEASK